MASGETLLILTALNNQPPASGFATLDTRNAHPVLDFGAAASEDAIFGGTLPRHYGGGGITIALVWMASTATSGAVVWETSFERHQAGTDDLDTDSFAAASTVTGTTSSVSGSPAIHSTTHTNGAQMDSLAVGESFRLRVRRNGGNANDTMAGDAELLRVELRES